MSDLIHVANQAIDAELIDEEAITLYNEAIDLVPRSQRTQLRETIFALAVQDNVFALQNLINTARTDASKALAIAKSQQREIKLLQDSLTQGLERLHQYHEARHEATNARIDRHEQEIEKLKRSPAFAKNKPLFWLFTAIALLSLMLLQQSQNVRDSWHLQQEVRQ